MNQIDFTPVFICVGFGIFVLFLVIMIFLFCLHHIRTHGGKDIAPFEPSSFGPTEMESAVFGGGATDQHHLTKSQSAVGTFPDLRGYIDFANVPSDFVSEPPAISKNVIPISFAHQNSKWTGVYQPYADPNSRDCAV